MRSLVEGGILLAFACEVVSLLLIFATEKFPEKNMRGNVQNLHRALSISDPVGIRAMAEKTLEAATEVTFYWVLSRVA